MKIAGIQINSSPDIGKNVTRAVEMAEVAAEKGARVICYPELFLSPWFPQEEEKAHLSRAIDSSNDTLDRFKQLSKKTQTVLIIPFFESSKGKYYNSAAVFDSGKLAGVYRKVHLPDLPNYREQFYFSPGDGGFPVFETSHGTIGIQICWDNLFPEGARILALKGAEVIFAPNAASQNTHHLWEKTISANAFANNVYIFRVNRVGKEEGINFYGRSFCVDPWGEMASELAGSKEAIVLADVDPKEREAARETWGFLKHRRPGEYGEILR
jgi:N-carbamoylputrescine amidase